MKKSAVFVVRLALAVTFLISATAKLISPVAFGASLTGFGLLTAALVPFLAYFIPVVELLLALALLRPVQVQKTALFSAALLVIFIAAR